MVFAFNPPTGLNDVTQFPDEDALIRQHIQTLLQQIPDYIDNTLKLSNVPYSKITHSLNQSIPNSTDVGLQFDTDIFDSNSMHSTSVNISRMVINTDGVYQLTASVGFDVNTTGHRVVQFKVNGTTWIPGITSNAVSTLGIGTNLVLTTLYMFSTNDYIEVFVNQNSGGALNVVTGNTFFTAVKVG